jgi:hypothetical protein
VRARLERLSRYVPIEKPRDPYLRLLQCLGDIERREVGHRVEHHPTGRGHRVAPVKDQRMDVEVATARNWRTVGKRLALAKER